MQNNIFIISGPSGSGQDSIIEGLKKYFSIERVITTTTRAMRDGESQQNPYYFISKEEFKKGVEANSFFEFAKEYNNNFYGVTFQEIERVKNCGKIGIWRIEYQGVITAKKLTPNIIAILITAPLDVLEQRIKNRDKNASEQFIKNRMEYTREFLKHKDIYDYEIENKQGRLNETIKKVANIIEKYIISKK